MPAEIYHSNQDLKDWEIDFVYNFIDQFPNDGICILTQDSLVPIENIEHVFEGELYGSNGQINNISTYFEAKLFDRQFFETFQVIFDTHRPLLAEAYTFHQKLENLTSLPSFVNFDFNLDTGASEPCINQMNQSVQDESPAGIDDTYSLAA